MGKHTVYKVRGGIGHAAPATRRTDATPLAGQRQQLILAARLAFRRKNPQANTPQSRNARSSALDELRDVPPALLLPREKCFQIPGDRAIEHGLFGFAGTVRIR